MSKRSRWSGEKEVVESRRAVNVGEESIGDCEEGKLSRRGDTESGQYEESGDEVMAT
jgi:hypothetical protein